MVLCLFLQEQVMNLVLPVSSKCQGQATTNLLSFFKGK